MKKYTKIAKSAVIFLRNKIFFVPLHPKSKNTQLC